MGAGAGTVSGTTAHPEGRTDGALSGSTAALLGPGLTPSSADLGLVFRAVGALLPLGAQVADRTLQDVEAYGDVEDCAREGSDADWVAGEVIHPGLTIGQVVNGHRVVHCQGSGRVGGWDEAEVMHCYSGGTACCFGRS